MPMNEVFDLLSRNRLKNDTQIESIIMREWSISDIINLSSDGLAIEQTNIKYININKYQ
jgi:hypothetical protein